MDQYGSMVKSGALTLPSGYLTVCHGKSPFLKTVNHLFRLGPSIPWQTVSHNQRVTFMKFPRDLINIWTIVLVSCRAPRDTAMNEKQKKL